MPDREAIRAELEATRVAFETLLASLSDQDWRSRSGNPDLLVKELMWHMAWAMGWMARSVDAIKAGKSLRLPSAIIEPGRKLAMRWLARTATPEAAARTYAEGHAALLDRLHAMDDDDWQRSANRFGELRTVAWYFEHPPAHFEEHARDVRAVLSTAGVAVDHA
jgi:hypothetical protein